jgi:hypothetical protein
MGDINLKFIALVLVPEILSASCTICSRPYGISTSSAPATCNDCLKFRVSAMLNQGFRWFTSSRLKVSSDSKSKYLQTRTEPLIP